MALKLPTPVSFARAVKLCWLAIVSPASFDAIDRADSAGLKSRPDAVERYRIDAVRQGLGGAFVWGAAAALIGLAIGSAAAAIFGPSAPAATGAAVIGTSILLWATLAHKGWEVQTFSNATLTERVNRWIYRGLYAIGTTFVVMAVSWSAFA